MIRFAFIYLLSFLFLTSNAYSGPLKQKKEIWALEVNYYCPVDIPSFVLYHPGLKIGMEQLINNKRKEGKSRKNLKISEFQFLAIYNIGYYNKANDHQSLFIIPEIAFRHVANKGFLFDFYMGAGIKKMEPYNSSKITINNWSDNIILTTHVSGGLGWDFTKNLHIPILFHLKGSISMGRSKGLTAIEAGFGYKF